MVAVAAIGSAVVGGVASSKASKKASKRAQQTAQENNSLQRDIFTQNQAALAPFQANGGSSTTAIGALLGLPRSDPNSQNAAFENFRNSTGYQQQFN